MKTVFFYEGSYQFKTLSTLSSDQEIREEWIHEVLTSQANYRRPAETLWAEVRSGRNVSRYSLTSEGTLEKREFSIPN